MDDVRVGTVVRALRRRRGWTQRDLAGRSRLSQSSISLIERGHVDTFSLRTVRRLLGRLEVQAGLDLRWRAGGLDRLLDARHASLVGLGAARLRGLGWEVELEVTYAIYGERGSIDLVAWRHDARSLLVVEVKSEITAAESTLRKLDEKLRLGPTIARERFGWRPAAVSALLVLPDTSTARRRMQAADGLLASALPVHGLGLRHWLERPRHGIRGHLFLSDSSAGGRRQRIGRGPAG